ncbi:DUF192 domain-containing protein [Persicimonas caeni]|uniref:DUF192 domain-containing protein n=1 Tax=Persicimonas caeni TaxID=2292766 RepID=A0A4Y6PZE0_PERCE|nr:DUF192 domain-containing protein [Persicimonas caeni]QDG53691.1 DUF192 domain-containing protein [Persicimonas caeni]QED34912.1 DUF192 domain-containing protein [Persicimonas caeni]
MSCARTIVALLVALTLVACGDGQPPAPSCPPAEEPPAFGRACSADGECSGYLVCIDQACGWPEAMSGVEGQGTTTITFTRADETLTTYTAEVAAGDLARSRGLAERPCMQPGWGMLFVHPDEEELQYTVEAMRFPIDLVFADADGVVVAVASDLTPGAPGLISSGAPAKYAVELAAGEVEGRGIEVGDGLVVE